MKPDPTKELNLIGQGTSVEGKIKTQGSVRVDGKIVGEITASESIAIGLTGEVEGTVTAKNATVGGKLRGSLTVTEKIVFEGKSVIRGDIRAAKLVVDEGCMFDGKVSMADRGPTHDQRH